MSRIHDIKGSFSRPKPNKGFQSESDKSAGSSSGGGFDGKRIKKFGKNIGKLANKATAIVTGSEFERGDLAGNIKRAAGLANPASSLIGRTIKKALPLAEGGSLMMPEGMQRGQDEGMPEDTYPNIPPDEMEEAMASQMSDEDTEENYINFVMDQTLTEDEQNYLEGALAADPKLSEIVDKVLLTATEFSGDGEVDGPGTGVSDSIPARLSDGEFVITKKATDQIGADNLQRMMDDAERAYDGGYQMKAVGGYMFDKDESETASPSKIDEEIKRAMIGSNKIPSLQ